MSAEMLLVVMLPVVVATVAMMFGMLDVGMLDVGVSGMLDVGMLAFWDALFLGCASWSYGEIWFWNVFSMVCYQSGWHVMSVLFHFHASLWIVFENLGHPLKACLHRQVQHLLAVPSSLFGRRLLLWRHGQSGDED